MALYRITYRRDMDYRFRHDYIEAETKQELEERMKPYLEHNDDCWEEVASPDEIERYNMINELKNRKAVWS